MTSSWSFVLQLLQWCTVQLTLDLKDFFLFIFIMSYGSTFHPYLAINVGSTEIHTVPRVKASLSLHQFSRKSQSLNNFFCENLLYWILSKCQQKIVETGQNFISPQKWSTVYVTLIFAKPIDAQQHSGEIATTKFHLTGSRNMKITGNCLPP